MSFVKDIVIQPYVVICNGKCSWKYIWAVQKTVVRSVKVKLLEGAKKMIVNRYEMHQAWWKKIMHKMISLAGCKNLYRDMSSQRRYRKAFDNLALVGGTQLCLVEIETINRCNGICPFCPVNRRADIRKTEKMPEERFTKICNDLKEMGYRNAVSLSSNNEPFLDGRIVELAEIARSILPDNTLFLYTNGSLLDREKVKRIIKSLSYMIIDNYNDDFEINENIKDIAELCNEDEEINRKVQIHLRKQNEVMYSRGGQAPNRQENLKLRTYPCLLPYTMMTIRPSGLCSLCCNDAYGKMTLGDVNRESIKDIWCSDTYIKIREMIKNNITDIELCKYCDSIHIFMPE